MRGKGLKAVSGEVQRGDQGKIPSLKEQCCSGTAARGGGAATVPEGVPEPWRCGTEGRSQWAWWDGLG